ncbi:MAG TPA: class I SAM-dependent methyltransferase [Vicinamibacterales bacterium]|nr:class I SAM-dependent methyltransferase [Vicinamibacterales bacterium]
MSVSTEIDRLLRHSMLARAQPIIRGKAPWLHKALLVARDAVLPVRSIHGLTRYQREALDRFATFRRAETGPVLEIGSDVDGRVLKELASQDVNRPVGLNVEVNTAAYAEGRTAEGLQYDVVVGDARHLPFDTQSISSIFSVATFEHIHDIDVALREMYRVLKPGGVLYSNFGPIWSCSIGHHVFAAADGVEARHWKPGLNPVPHYAHLLMAPTELRSAVLQKSWVTPNLADAIVSWIYEGRGVNRVFYDDYVRSFRASSFAVRVLAPVREHVPARVTRELRRRYPDCHDFSVRMVEAVLEKAVS